MLKKILNKKLTLVELSKLFGTYDTEIYNKWLLLYNLEKELNPGFSNGRVNHIWIQKMICDLSGGFIEYGGQGNKKSDCTVGNYKVETKAYEKGKTKFHSAASSFFANNCKVPEYRRLLSESKRKAKNFVFKHSYDKNDNYLLTSTANLQCDFEDVELIFVETSKVVSCLEPDYIKCDINKIKQLIQERK